ncbi:ABC transporter permease [Frateuria hangzhouensis]|uniref:ABC transporter permease n=1 Tax=Frateuria hangzhouensis TaxID=2995589 RepID=UPI002260DD72|nr:ABC transporter permease [Frateuria sp. STR12]MCX7513667.1 ABC transporter permease [Frateuria sp. STR12]
MFGYYLDLALRSLKRNKALTALMVLAIAVGIGASMTTLTVVHLLSGDPIPGKSSVLYFPQVDPENPALAEHTEPYPAMDYRSALDLWSAQRADRQAIVTSSPVKVRVPDSGQPPLMLSMLSTTADFFPMFEVPFQYGAGWSAQEDARHARVAVITADLNDKLFGGDNSVGRTLRVRDTDVRIVGVLKPWRPTPLFYDPWSQNFSRTEDVFAPFGSSLDINQGNFQAYTCWHVPEKVGDLRNSDCVWVWLWVELDSPAKVQAYGRFLAGYAEQQKAQGRFATGKEHVRLRDLMTWLTARGMVPDDVRLQAWLASAFLVICLFNAVGLLLAKFLRRSGEIGVRRALGASRRAIFSQCLVEAGLIGLLGGILGWLLTLAGLWLIRRQPVDYAHLAHLDTTMFLATFALAVAASLLAGLIPALRASRVVPSWQLKAL